MAHRYDAPLGPPPPLIELAVVGVTDDGAIRMSLTSGGKLLRYSLKPHVAATLLKQLADGLVEHAELTVLACQPRDHG